MLALPVVVLVTVIGSVVAAVPVAEISAPWRSEKETLGLVPLLSTASRRVMARAWCERSRMRRVKAGAAAENEACAKVAETECCKCADAAAAIRERMK